MMFDDPSSGVVKAPHGTRRRVLRLLVEDRLADMKFNADSALVKNEMKEQQFPLTCLGPLCVVFLKPCYHSVSPQLRPSLSILASSSHYR
jgi:hypothetical protein